MPEVLLGTAYELHTGLHGLLVDVPPPGIDYVVADGTHTLLFDKPTDSLFAAQAIAECIDFGAGPQIVHSAKWPVLNRRGWVVDFDDFGYPMFCSHYGLTQQFREREACRATRSTEYACLSRWRFDNMCRAFAHPSCKALLVSTNHEKRRIEQWLTATPTGTEVDPILGKVAVVPPAHAPAPLEIVHKKWTEPRPLQVVFCGRGFEAKRGQWALDAFGQLLDRNRDVECTYIGDIPDRVRHVHDSLLRRMTVLDRRPHGEVLARLAEAHVLFHPAENESVGSVIVEAIAAGMAVITACGPGMEQTREWLAGGGEFLIERGARTADERAAFCQALLAAAADRAAARDHGLINYATATHGCLSLARRDDILTQVYHRCLAHPAPAPLTLHEFAAPANAFVYRATSRELARQRTAYKQRLGLGYQLDVFFEP